MKGRTLVIAALLLALAQIGFLAWTIAGRAAILRDGREVLIKVEPVDPRDLLRGDYVTFRYEIGRLPMALVENAPAGEFVSEDQSVYVRLARDADGYWRPRKAAFGAPAAGGPSPEEVDLRGDVAAGWTLGPDSTLSVDYGIDRFYVPEGEGRAIEQDLRERPFGILAAVGQDGTAQIKALMDGDTKLYEEPLY